MHWFESYAVHFKRLDEKEVRNWEEEMTGIVRSPTPAEMTEAVQEYAADRSRNPRLHLPGPYQLAQKIRMSRKEDWNANNPPEMDCEICGGCGWLTFYCIHTTGGLIPGRDASKNGIMHETACTFCICHAGHRLTERKYDDSMGKLTRANTFSSQAAEFACKRS